MSKPAWWEGGAVTFGGRGPRTVQRFLTEEHQNQNVCSAQKAGRPTAVKSGSSVTHSTPGEAQGVPGQAAGHPGGTLGTCSCCWAVAHFLALETQVSSFGTALCYPAWTPTAPPGWLWEGTGWGGSETGGRMERTELIMLPDWGACSKGLMLFFLTVT